MQYMYMYITCMCMYSQELMSGEVAASPLISSWYSILHKF